MIDTGAQRTQWRRTDLPGRGQSRLVTVTGHCCVCDACPPHELDPHWCFPHARAEFPTLDWDRILDGMDGAS